MDRLRKQQIDAGFERISALRKLEKHRAEFQDPDFWRRINPDLTISDNPFRQVASVEVAPAEVDRCSRLLVEEGYMQTRPLVPEARMEPLVRGIRRLVERGIPSGFLCLYDEYYQIFQGLEPLFAPLLGPRYRWVNDGNWAFYVPPGAAGSVGFLELNPHRDTLGPDPSVLERRLPTILSVWIPLNDVSTAESCIYIVPADLDPDYFTTRRDVDRTRFKLQSVRALPAEAGSVLAWSTHLIHWGGAASPHARDARMSVAVYFQRAGLAAYHPSAVDAGDSLPFPVRLRITVRSLAMPGFFG